METFGIVMAGGSGTRFWPLSTTKKPKQFLNLTGNDVLINEAINRLLTVCKKQNVFIVTNKSQKENILKVSGNIIKNCNFISEPFAKNTAASIGFTAIKIKKYFGDGVMVITPSDAYIKEEGKFALTLKDAIAEAKTSKKIITIGIQPTFPATGYGYIEFENSASKFKHVLKFVEKPSEEVAKKYIKLGNFLWNSGMFICKVSQILNQIERFLPKIYDGLNKIYNRLGTENEWETITEVYSKITPVSIDYGVMEKSKNLLVINGDFGWNDVGSWDALKAIYKEDNNKNVSIGNVVALESENNVAYSSNKLITLFGVENLIVAETPTAVLVCSKQRAQDIKKIVEELKAKGLEELL